MPRRSYRTLLILAVPFITANSLPNLATAQTPSSRTPVQVFVSAAAKDHTPVIPDATTLIASIDKQPAQVLSVRAAKDDRLLFAVMVDISSSGQAQQKATKETAAKIFQMLSSERKPGISSAIQRPGISQ